MAGGRTQSSSSSGIFFQGDGESQGFINSHLSSSYGNSTNSGPGSLPGYHNLSMVSGEMHNPLMISVSTSGPSAGASSLATDANSGLSGGPQLQRSASINNESYRLPASPMSFSSNNVSMSGSSVVDGSTVIRQNTQHDPSVPQGGSGSSATSLLTSNNGQIPFSAARRVPESSFFQDPNNLTQVRKKPRIDTKQDDMLQQQILRQWLQRQDMLQQQQQGQNPQFQLLLQQQKLRQHQQFMQSLPPLQRAQLQQQQQQQLQMRQQLQQQGMQQQLIGSTRPFENSVCARRLMQYLYHQRQRPSDNSIVYWRKFVAEYFSPRANKRWCLSLYDNEGHHALGAFPQAAMDAWQCDICSSKSGRGFEATYDVLPRLNEIKFASGVLDELLYLGVPCERRFASGIMMLEYSKAIQESVYEHIRVVREGHLRIIFSQELKILSWEFCTRRHEELLPRRLVAPQVNQLLQVAQKCQSTISESGSDGVPQQDLQANSNMVMAAGRQLAKSLESHSLNDLGFSKRYVRCLQISEVVSSMKDLIDICHNQKAGPIEALKNYQCHARTGKLQMREIEQLAISRGLPTDRNSLSKLMASCNTGINAPMNGNNQMSGQGTLAGSAQGSFALTNYQGMLMKQNHMSSNPNSKVHQEPSLSSSFVKTNSSPSPSYQGPTSLLPGSIHSPSISGISSHLSPQRQVGSSSNSSPQPNNQQSSSYSSNQALEQHMIHQLWQQMSNSGQQQSPSGDQMSFSVVNTGRNRTAYGQNMATPRSSNSFKGMSNNNKSSSAADCQSVVHSHSEELMIPNTSHDLSDNHGFFSSEVEDDSLGYNNSNTWKV